MRLDAQRRPEIVRQLADYERISGILWIVLGAVQILAVVTAFAGVWNIVAGLSRLAMVKRVTRMEPDVPKAYEGVTGLIVIGLVNLLLGAVIGLLFVAFDVYVRKRVLANRWVFEDGKADQDASEQALPPGALDRLEQLGRLRESGVLTDGEFTAEKTRLLSGTT